MSLLCLKSSIELSMNITFHIKQILPKDNSELYNKFNEKSNFIDTSERAILIQLSVIRYQSSSPSLSTENEMFKRCCLMIPY